MKGPGLKQYKEKVASDARKNIEKLGEHVHGFFGNLFERKDENSEIGSSSNAWSWLRGTSQVSTEINNGTEVHSDNNVSKKGKDEQEEATSNEEVINDRERGERNLRHDRRGYPSFGGILTVNNRSRQARWRERQRQNRFAFAYCLSLAANIGEVLESNDHFWKIQELLDPLQQDIVRRTILTHQGRQKLISNKEMRAILNRAPRKHERAFYLYVSTAVAHLRSLDEEERLFVLKLERKARKKIAERRVKRINEEIQEQNKRRKKEDAQEDE